MTSSAEQKLSLSALIALVVGSFFGYRGFLRMVAQRERTESLRLAIEELRTENGRLAGEIAALVLILLICVFLHSAGRRLSSSTS